MTRNVIAVVDDLFFATKIRGTAEQLGVETRFARTIDDAMEATRKHHPSLIIADLHSQQCDPIKLAKLLKADEELRSISLLGFFSHVQTALQQRAEQAGFDLVIPRSALAKHLIRLLKGD